MINTSSGYKILVVDYDPLMSRILERKLMAAGHEVNSASDGVTALNRLQEGYLPDAITLEIMMPKMSGFEVIERLKANEQWKNIPVFVFSNLSSTEDVLKKCMELGCTSYNTKSSTAPDDLIQKITTTLANKNQS